VNIRETIKYRSPLPSGSYIAIIADVPKPREISDPARGRQGISLALRVAEGDAQGRLASFDLIIQPHGYRADRDLLVLDQWCDCLGVDSADSLTELIEKLQKAGIGKRLEFTIQRNEWQGGVSVALTAVRVAPDV
jgi:hypothetical protein